MAVPFVEDIDIPNHYFDNSAFVSVENKTSKYCFFDCNKCNNLRDKDYEIYKKDNLIQVKSAFGGIALIRSYIFKNIKWASIDKCEHILFCKEIRKYGKIVIVPWVKGRWHKYYEKIILIFL